MITIIFEVPGTIYGKLQKPYTKNLFNVSLKSEGDITMNRTCDGCSACCKTHGVRSIQKLPGEQCPHCRKIEGGV